MHEDLNKRQEELHREADAVLQESGIIDLLSKYGKVEVGGSYKTGLMVWRDLDVSLTPQPLDDDIWELARNISTIKRVNQITIQNNITKPNPNLPDGYYFGLKYGNDGITWKIDIWLANSLPQQKYDEMLLKKLNDENRRKILEIKNQVFENPKYRKSFFSVDIYNAVLDANVNTITEFEDYLQSHNKSL